jgi:uroporphyrinogen-III decarboxylase
MTSRQRFITALERRTPDRLPVTTHHLMISFLDRYLGGMSREGFFDRFGMDAILWTYANAPDSSRGEYFDPTQPANAPQPRRVVTDTWRFEEEPIPGLEYPTVRYRIVTPTKNLTMVLQSNEHTSWVTERLVKEKTDIEVIAAYAPPPRCDVQHVAHAAREFGERGIVRGAVAGFDLYGQPGCWQDAAVLFGIENLIMATYDDPEWVHAFLGVLRDRKLTYLSTLLGARYDLIELGGGDASSTVISPGIFDTFVAPYDTPLINAAHAAGQRIVYHTCGGMMPFLERLAGMGPDAMETLTPPGMGGDTRLREAKERIGERVCLIGGFDQFHFFVGCTPEETRKEVKRCFAEAGTGGGYILSPSDHFFDAELPLLDAFADEARRCVYTN